MISINSIKAKLPIIKSKPFIALYIVIVIVLAFFLHVSNLKSPKSPKPLSEQESLFLDSFRANTFEKPLYGNLQNIPYETSENAIDVSAASAILIDAATGAILYQKNADEHIPPASMTKLVVMYIIFEEIEKGNLHYDDYVNLPPESWVENLPADSSLMFLRKGQKVTVKELLTGLAVASGNDAAMALAIRTEGSVEAFVKRMNETVKKLGLNVTHFVEPSGYDEHNITTAKEFVTFARSYITRFPDSIKLFHSCKEIYYPLAKNLPNDQAAIYGDSKAIHQLNTNPLLGKLDGVDGLKTGFIYESRYNLALTAKRGNNRFISITMKGAGIGTKQGQEYRVKDGTKLMELAFNNYNTYRDLEVHNYVLPVLASKTASVNLVPAIRNIALTVPLSYKDITVTASMPPYIFGENKAGDIYGELTYKYNNMEIAKIPLVIDRNTKKCSSI
nr:D-alanyl-D-alanine carboxypeptidase [Treponema sp.]